jgi:hypothetical protein
MAVLTNIPNNTSARDWRDTMNSLIKRVAALEAAGVPVATPAPAFTTQPSVSPTSGTAGSTVYAATPGTVSNGSVVSRAWLLNGTAISTGVTAVPASAGTLTYQETASGPGGTTTSTVQVAAVTAATVTPTPAPSFTSQPSISPNTGTAGATTFTATAGNVSNGSITARSWTINGTVISTGLTASPASSGTLTYQETATGSGGTTQSTVQQVTVATAAAAAPAFTAQPTISPSTGTAGTTTYTATPGAVSNGTITSRAWALNGSTISTGLTAAPASAGTLTYQEFATGTGGSASSSVLTRTVSAATPTLTLSPASISIASNAAAGTTVSNIANVPSGVTPSVTPNDGRLVIAGDASAGWKVVVGMSALSAGQLNFTVAASGATSATGVLTITAASTSALLAASAVNQNFNTVDSNASYQMHYDRWSHYLPVAQRSIVFSWRNWFMSSGSAGELIDTGNPIIITSAVAECNGVVVPLTFGGASVPYTVPDGANDLRCQTLTPEMFGFTGGQFPPGTVPVSKTIADLGALGAKVPTSPRNVADISGSQTGFFNPANTTLGNQSGVGAFTSTGASLYGRQVGWQPVCLGVPVVSTGKVWFALADSITAGTGDNTPNRDGRGWFQRACSDMGVPSINMAVHGSGSVAGKDDPRLSYWMQFATDGVIYYGTNDFSANSNGGAVTLAPTVRDRVGVRRAQMKAAGLNKVGIVRLGISAASTDNWTTEGNQTPNWQPGNGTDVFNAYDFISLGFDFVVPNNANRGTSNDHVWFADGTMAQHRGFDAAHPSTGGALALANEAKPFMLGTAVTTPVTDTTPPVITSAVSASNPENSAYSVTLSANETVTFSKRTGADTALFTLSGSTLSLTARNFEVPTDSDANNTYVANLRATDTAGNITDFIFTLTTTDVAEGGSGTVGTVLFSDAFANASTTTDQAFTDHVSESGHHWAKAGTPDVATVWGTSGNQAVSANASGTSREAVRTSGVVTPTRITDLVLPSQNYDVILPMVMRTRINNVFYGIYVRGQDSSKDRYNVGLFTSTNNASGTWMVRRQGGAAGATATFTLVGQSSPGDGKVAGDRWTMKISVRTVGSDVNIKIYVDSGSGYVLMTDATDVAANNPLLTGDIGLYSTGGLSTTTGTGVKADVVPMQVISA